MNTNIEIVTTLCIFDANNNAKEMKSVISQSVSNFEFVFATPFTATEVRYSLPFYVFTYSWDPRIFKIKAVTRLFL
jgi:hypothetical protein